jgi:predicted ATPase/DNA-binding CsgD family transcriptional regulator
MENGFHSAIFYATMRSPESLHIQCGASQRMVTQKWQAPYEGLSKRAVEILRLLSEGMSDREIAERLVMTINTVKWYNRQIYSILGVGSRTQAIARARELQLLGDDAETTPPLSIVPPRPRHNMPVETTHFIGREREIETIRRLLDTAHLLTLVGTPGTGKTRLALQVGAEVIGDFRDGVYFVSLAPITNPARVINAIASAVGVNEVGGQPLAENLRHALRDSHMLLILDNFEHLLPAAPQVSELLAAAPDLKVLATSREPLHLYGEQEYAVPTLSLPDPDTLDLQALAECESVSLFVQGARAVRPGFELTQDNAREVAQICLRLDGLPLAIELAAARTRLLTPSALLARLNSRLDTLTGGAHDLPPRQRTLRDTIEWSYNLLDDGEKTLFARLAVFRGGCSLEAVEAVCAPGLPIDIFDGLDSLVNKSLIQQKELSNGEPRFFMLETLHEYATECLEASGEAGDMRARHAQYFLELAEYAEPELRLAHSQRWFALLETEHENMQTVLRWSLDNDPTLGVRLAGALFLLWFAYGYHLQGYECIRQFLTRLDSVPTAYHAKLFIGAGHMTTLYDLEAAQQYFDRALQLSLDMGDRLNTAWSYIFKGYSMLNDPDAAFPVAEQGLAIFQELNHKPGIAQALNILGNLALNQGEYPRARQLYEDCLTIAQETREIRRIRYMLGNLARVAQGEGDLERALLLAEEALRLAAEGQHRLDMAECLPTLAGVIGEMGQPEQAARLFGTWEATLERLGASPQAGTRHKNERNIAAVRAQLGLDAFQAAWEAGRATPLEEAVTAALARGQVQGA